MTAVHPPPPPARPAALRPPPAPPARPARPAAALPAEVPHRLTGRQVLVDRPLRLGAGGRRAAVEVQFLRECLSHDLAVVWEPDPGDPLCTESRETTYDVTLLRHLPAPVALPGEPPAVAEWRARRAYGQLYHRNGPGFVTVLDRREPPVAARFTLDHPDLLAAFRTTLDATAVAGLNQVQREAVGILVRERLVLVTDGWAVALPPRIRHWPAPCTGI
ncbi:DUF5825 family protein [Streptomyces sp. NPDC003023]|uniref:DUF5825 family protein n=1 Tax=Streptomyces sp. NPDC003023 TaxID=3364675 RepID=UPI0036C9B681